MNVVRQLRSRDDATPRVIVLCCARDGRPRLGPVVEQLAAHGHQVEVVSDVDTGVAGLLSTVQRRGAAALYVLFESPAFCGAAVSSLQLQLRTRGVPAHHVRVTPFDQTPVTQLSEELGPMSAQTQVPPPPPQVSRQGGNGPQLATAARPIDRSGAQPLVPPVDQSNRDIADAYTPMGSIKAGLRRTVGRSPLILAISIIGLAFVIAGSAFVILGGLDPQEVEVAAAATNPEPQAEPEAAAEPEPEPEPEPAPEIEAADDAAIVSADEADGQTELPEGAEQPEGAEPTEAASVEDVPGDPDADPATDTPAPDSDVVTEEAPNPDDAEAVYEALANRKVRALDILLMAPEPVRTFKRRRKTYPKKMTWTDAEAYCRDLDIDGVRSWRLPTIGELSSLTTGRMMPSGKFWSRTKGDTFGQSRVVWNSDQQRMGPAPTSWKGGRVICVRTTIRPDEHPPEEE